MTVSYTNGDAMTPRLAGLAAMASLKCGGFHQASRYDDSFARYTHIANHRSDVHGQS